MSHSVELSDEEYEKLTGAADALGQTPEQLLHEWVAELARDPRVTPRHYETDDWLRHLGVSEEVIERTREQAERDADA